MPDWLNRMYERDGVRYLAGALAFLMGMAAVLAIPGGLFIGARFEGLSVSQFLSCLLIIESLAAAMIAFVLLLARPQTGVVMDWFRGDRSPERALEVADVGRRALRAAVFRLALLIGLVVAPITVVTILEPVERLNPGDIVVMYVGTLLTLAYALLFIWYWAELFLRPVNADLDRHAPGVPGVHLTDIGLAARTLIGLVAATVFAGIFVGAATVEHGEGGAALARTWGLALVVAPFPLVLVFALTTFILTPVGDLIRGSRSVGAGDLDTRVPAGGSDELGALSKSFNQMVDGLREREELREHNVELNSSLLDSRARIVATADAERRRMERDLHDGAQQHLVLLRLRLGQVLKATESDPAAATVVGEAREDLDRAMAELRDLAHGIYPAALESGGLGEALQETAQRSALPTKVEVAADGRYPAEVEAAVYFCCVEALQNSAKYAGEGARAVVRLNYNSGMLIFEVEDDGAGFDVAAERSSAGLHNLADRTGALGGSIEIVSEPGKGTRVAGRVPTDCL